MEVMHALDVHEKAAAVLVGALHMRVVQAHGNARGVRDRGDVG
jgi:hypothetical protein